MPGDVAVNDADAYVVSALEGIGVIQSARFMAIPHLKSGRLIEVLSQWKPLPMPISVIYPHSRHLSPSVRVFVDWIAELFGQNELLSGDKNSNVQAISLGAYGTSADSTVTASSIQPIS